jgi:hypothetical protein
MLLACSAGFPAGKPLNDWWGHLQNGCGLTIAVCTVTQHRRSIPNHEFASCATQSGVMNAR